MLADRREFIRAVGVTTGAIPAMSAAGIVSAMQPVAGIRTIKAIAFDAYGTLFDVFSVTSLCEQLFPGHGTALAQLWRAKQLQYTWLRSLMARHKDFWQLTEDGLDYATKSLKLSLTSEKRTQLMDAYLSLAAFPDVKPGLEALKRRGLRLAILSNGEPKMLQAAATSAGISPLLDGIISVEEVNIFKPSPRVYALAPTRLNVSASETRFRLVEFVGRQRRRRCRSVHVLDSAQRRRTARGARVSCPACRERRHRPRRPYRQVTAGGPKGPGLRPATPC